MTGNYYQIKTPAAGYPVTWEEAKSWGRGISDLDQSSVESLICSATNQLEKLSGRVFISREYHGFFSGIDVSDYEKYPFITIMRSPLISISLVELAGEIKVQDVDFFIKCQSSFSRVLFPSINSLQSFKGPWPIKINFQAGYEPVDDLIKNAILMLVLFKYENRGDVSADNGQSIPLEVKRIICDNYRVSRVY